MAESLLDKVKKLEGQLYGAHITDLTTHAQEVKEFVMACASKNKEQVAKITLRQMANLLNEHYGVTSINGPTLGKFITRVFGKPFTEL